MKKTIILTLMFLLVMSFASPTENAIPLDADNLISLFTYHETEGNITDLKGYDNWDKTAQTNDVLYRAKAFQGYAYNWTGDGDGAYFTAQNQDYREYTSTNDYALFAIVNLETTTLPKIMFSSSGVSEQGTHWWVSGATDNWGVYGGDGGSGDFNSDIDLNYTKWGCFGYIVNGSGITGWVNGSISGAEAYSTNDASAGTAFLSRGYAGSSRAAQNPRGMIAELAFFSPSISAEKFNEYCDIFFAGDVVGDTSPPVITHSTPVNNSIVNDIPLNFIINVTDDSSFNQSCFLRNESDLLYSNSSVIQNVLTTFIYSTTANQVSTNLFNITCFDNSANNNSAELLLNISIDTLNPILSVNSPLNNTIFIKTIENITYNIGCSDNDPFLLNFTIFNSSNDVIFSAQNSTPAGTFINLTGAVDITSFEIGNYKANFSCSDTHTSKEIPDYSYVKDLTKKMIYFNTGNNIINITLISKPELFIINKLSVEKLNDRYGFGFIGKEKTPYSTYRFLLSTKQKLNYIKESNYKAHFVSGTNWIDFENNDVNAQYLVSKINDNLYQIMVYTNDLNFISIGGLNIVTTEHKYKIIEYTALDHFDFEIPEFELDSAEFITIFNGSINLSRGTHAIIKGSGILEKITLPQSTATSGILLFNNQEIFSGTIVSTDDIISFNFPIGHIDLIAGENNISLQISEDNNGAIKISNLIIEVDIDMTSRAGEVIHNHSEVIINKSGTSFTNIANVSITKPFNSSTHLDIHDKLTLKTGASSNTLCYAVNNITDERTPVYERWLQTINDTGHTGINYISKIKTIGSETWLLYCAMSNTDIIEHDISMYLLDLIDDEENIINHFQNESLEIQSLAAGTTKIGGFTNFTFRNATETDLIITIIAQSTSGQQNGASSPSFKVNATGINESKCGSLNNKRGFISNEDIGTIKFYMDCNSSIGFNTDFNLFAVVQAGESLNILNASISGYEINEFILAAQNIAPIVIIKFPFDNSKVNRTATINFSASDVNNDNFSINISLINDSSDTIQIASNLDKNTVNFTFNFSTVNIGFHNLTVTAFETETAELFTSSETIRIENIFPVINISLISPENNSIETTQSISFNFRTDVNANCSLYLNSTFNQSLISSIGTNAFPSVTLTNHSWLWNVNCTNASLDLFGQSETFIVHVNIITSLLSIRECPVTTAGMLTLLMIIGISLFFILIGFMFRLGVMGVFGAIMLMVCSWYITPCQTFFAYIVALFSFVLIIWFATTGLGFNNTSLK